MIRILFCDDDLIFSDGFIKSVSQRFADRKIETCVQKCHSGEDLLKMIDECAPDLLFLDLSLADADGYALAEEIRRRRMTTEIVFVTGHPERMRDAFPFRPIGFLSKPPSDEDIDETVDRFLFFYWQADAHYAVSSRDAGMRIPLKDVLYFESAAHRVAVHRISGAEPIWHTRRLDDIDEELKAAPFLRIHKSFLVHLDAIASVDRANMRVVLVNGQELPISRSRYAQVIDRFIHYRLR